MVVLLGWDSLVITSGGEAQAAEAGAAAARVALRGEGGDAGAQQARRRPRCG